MIKHIKSSDFENEVISSDIPVVVDFYADWCMPCKMLSPVIEELSDQYDGRVSFVKINTDDAQDLAVQFNVMSIPTLIMFKSGEVRDQVVGLMSKEGIEEKIDEMMSFA